LGQLPLETVQVLQEVVAPLRRRGGPHHLEAAGDRVAGLTRTVGTLPAQALLLDRRALGLGTHQVGVACTVGLAEAVPADDQRRRLLVVTRDPAAGLPALT